jgi:hypothetical protein
VVRQEAVHLFDGHAGLHEIGINGNGQYVGLLDDEITSGDLTPFVAHRRASAGRLPRSGPTHGDRMAYAIVRAAPGCQLVAARVFDDAGHVLRPAIVDGIAAVCADRRVRLVNVSLEIRRISARCSATAPCRACLALRQQVHAGRIVVVAAGNQGETNGAITCPAAESEAVIVAATTGPQGSSAYEPPAQMHTETGTSVSAALITGGTALLLQAFPNLSSHELRDALTITATRLTLESVASVGAGRAHFYRAFRYLQHLRAGRQVDVATAEGLANETVRTLAGASGAGPITALEPQPLADSVARLRRAIELAPWGSELHLWLGLLSERHDVYGALLSATESVRLNWSDPDGHALISRLLHRLGNEPGATAELAIAEHLRNGRPLAAADALFNGMTAA